MTTITIQTLAAEALSHFEMRTRQDEEQTRYVTMRDDRPEWVSDLVYEAHAGMFPDDWRYETIRDALNFIEETGSDAGDFGDFAEAHVDVYMRDLLTWVGSHSYRVAVIDKSCELYGAPESLENSIRRGQFAELEEVYGLVYSFLEKRVES